MESRPRRDQYTGGNNGIVCGGWVCSGSSQASCTGGTQLYGYTAQRIGNRVTQSCDTVLGVCNSFGYDDFSRLTARTVTQGTVQNFTYTYDRFGNRWAQNAPQGGPSSSVSFNANNMINTAGYSYDAAGNMTSDGIHAYAYDADGNLISVDSGSTATYYYDSLNQRTRIAPTRGTYEVLWDAFGRRVSEWNASNHNFVEANAYTDSGPITIRSGGQTQFEHQNWLGTERLRTTYNGAVSLSIASLPWGDGHTPSGDNGDQHDFAGMDRDLEDNTEHATFRQYSTNVGRWQSPDPFMGSYDFTNPQSFNRYSYALNNPTNLVDPSGLDYGYDCGASCVGVVGDPPADPCSADPSSCGGWWFCEEYGCGAPVSPLNPTNPGGGSSGGPGAGAYGPAYLARLSAPSKGPTKGQCLGQALKNDGNGVSLALDVAGIGAGFLPGGGLVTGSARAANIAFSAQVGLIAASTGASTAYKSGPGIVFGILGGQAALTAKTAEALGEDAAEAFGESIPIIGVAVSAGALLYDGYQTYKAYSGCLAGVHE